MGKTEKILEWLKAIWFMNRNILKILDDQNEIKQKLEKIEETIKSPQYQVAELEKIKNTIDLLKENNEQEKKKLERGSQEEINKRISRSK
jgi:ferritin-like metal-binding protein YciE